MYVSSRKVRKVAIVATPFVAALLLSAQSTEPQKVTDLTIMGCLTQGDGPHQYVIKGQDKQGQEKTYVLTDHHRYTLEKHVGQKVSVSGSMKSISPDTERFKVSSLSKVADHCD